ncbi:phosphotransferase family protein [Oryzisolibacter sp. LB2S]|uniref:phosphotransferase family protein n=1 Tax=Alicycliphilus soli TaxID=3228789 RepID=UPI003459CF91
MLDDMTAVAQRLGAWLQARGQSGAEVLALQRSAGGYSNITLLGEIRSGPGAQAQRVVVRIQPEGAAVFPDCDVATQYRTMELLQGSGLPVPPLLGLELDVSVLGAPFFIMGRLDGRVPDENPLYHLEGWFHDLPPEELRRHWFAGIDGIAALARLDWRALGFSFLLPPEGVTPLQEQLRYHEDMLRWSEGLSGHGYPLLWRAHGWLVAHQPHSDAVALSWGDAKLGNCVFDQGRLSGMLDWERPALSDPVDDLAWWLMLDDSLSTGYGVPRLAGLPTREETVAHWERASGFSARHLPYYEVFAAWRFSILMTRIGRIFTERGWVPPEAEMDLRNGGSRLVELLAELHHF